MKNNSKPIEIRTYLQETLEKEGIDADKAIALAQKCYDEMPMWRPFGGATSFSEIDSAKDANEYSEAVEDETYALSAIIDNVIASDELGQADIKAAAIKKAADDYSSRVSAIRLGDQGNMNKSLLDKIKTLVFGEPTKIEETVTPGLKVNFKVYTDRAGAKRWVSVSSNAFEDREQEIFTTKALQEAVEHADKTEERGPLLVFHVREAEVGQCDYQAIAGRMLLESGTFDNTPLGLAAVKHFESTEEEYQVSIGYQYKAGDELDGQYDWLRIKERSICPMGTAANPYTNFKMLGEQEMDDRKVEALTKILGEENAKAIIASAEAGSKALEDANIRYKEANPTTEEAVAEAVKEEVPAVEAVATGLTMEQVTAAVQAAIAPFQTSIEAMGEVVKGVQDEVKAIKLDADAKMESPRYDPTKAVRPTDSEKNLLDAEGLKDIIGETKVETNAAAPYVEDLLRQLGVATPTTA